MPKLNEAQKAYQKAYHHAHREDAKAYREAHREQIKTNKKAYRQAHKGKEKTRRKAYYQAHREEEKAYGKAYAQAHREERRAHQSRRKAREKGVSTEAVDYEFIKKRDRMICGICKKKVRPQDLSFDHIIPLSKGGSNKKENRQPLCSQCNTAKGNRNIPLEKFKKQHPMCAAP